MNEDQAGPAHLQILRCYLMSQAPESPGGPLSSAGRVALTRPSEQTVGDSVVADIKGACSRSFHPGTEGSRATATIGTADRSQMNGEKAGDSS